MAPDGKKIWKKPEIESFATAEEAIAYYSKRGMLGHVGAIRKMSAHANELRKETEQFTPRKVVRR